MKRILITGKNSYVGNSFAEWVSKYPEKYEVEKISLRTDDWKLMDFSKYDVVLHVAGIAHRKETKKNKDLYFKVNRDLTYEIAKKSKRDGVYHFIFLSSMSVYGMDTGVITRNTIPKPKTYYGKSKLEAEQLIEQLNDGNFKVAIIRPPMIYGKDCKGNYVRLANLTMTFPLFPNIENNRSMIFSDNLSEFIRIIIDDQKSGLFFPQNREFVKTSDMVRKIAKVNGKNIKFTKIFNPIINSINISLLNKLFGDLYYDQELSIYDKDYNVAEFGESIYLTETGVGVNHE